MNLPSILFIAMGLGFPFLNIPILHPSLIIGVFAFSMTMAGMKSGEKRGAMGKK